MRLCGCWGLWALVHAVVIAACAFVTHHGPASVQRFLQRLLEVATAQAGVSTSPHGSICPGRRQRRRVRARMSVMLRARGTSGIILVTWPLGLSEFDHSLTDAYSFLQLHPA